ncbi:MAG: HTTM domain-containing protein [Balneolaceae bacterium]
MNLRQKLDNWIFGSFQVSSGGLGLYRIFVSLTILFFLVPSPGIYGYLAGLPADFYSPAPGPMMLFDRFPPESILMFLHYLLLISLTSMLIGFQTRWSSLISGLLMFTLKGFIFSIGKINHDLLLSVVPILFAFSHWGGSFSVDSLRKRRTPLTSGTDYGWPLVLLGLFIGFMMFTAGFPKILGGWLDPGSQAAQGHFLNQVYQKGRTDLLAVTALHWNHGLFWEALDYATILFETGFLVAIFRPRTTRLFISIAVLFHFSTMMIMNISFLFNFIAYAAFLDWPRVDRVLSRLWSRITGFTARDERRGLLFATLLALLYSGILWLDSSGVMPLESDLRMVEVIFITLALLPALYGIARFFKLSMNFGQ